MASVHVRWPARLSTAALTAGLILMELPACAAGAPVRTPGSDYVCPVTFPILEIIVSDPIPDLQVWQAGKDGKDQPLFDSALFFKRWDELIDKASARHRTWRIRLDQAPEQIFLRFTKPSDRGFRITSLQLIRPDGTHIKPLTGGTPALPPGTVVGKVPLAPAAGQAYAFNFSPADVVNLRDDEAQWPKTRFGIYYFAYAVSDPTVVKDGQLWEPKVEDVSPYDFIVYQANGPGWPSKKFFTAVKQQNSKNRSILRLLPPQGWVIDWQSDPAKKQKIIQQLYDTVDQIGVDSLSAVSISEEENGNLLQGFFWMTTPPLWLKDRLPVYEKETGRKLQWNAGACYPDPNVIEWIKPKIAPCYNEMYDALKARYPHLKVLQYLAIKDDGSGISWNEPWEIKADGWIYWLWKGQPQGVICKARIPGQAQAFELWSLMDSTANYIQRIRDSGIPNEDLYFCGFAFTPTDPHSSVEQLRMARKIGIANTFIFHPFHAFFYEGPRLHPDDSPNKTSWRWARDERLKALDYRRSQGQRPDRTTGVKPATQ